MALYKALPLLALLLGASEQQQLNSTLSLGEKIECIAPFTPVGGNCVYVDPLTTGTWEDMRAYCKTLGGDLVTLQDVRFYSDLVYFIHGNGWPDERYWVGATDEQEEGVWLWLDGSAVRMGTPFWVSCDGVQQPTEDTHRNCGILAQDYHLYLNDLNCNDASPHPICQE